MINFFRKIRQNLIQQNKMGKYFKYAIGEIFLVVIGIIIALQLNNWNEEQKKLKLKKTYVKALIADYSNDTLELKQLIQLNKTELDSLNALRKFIHSNSATPDDFRKLFENFETTNFIDYEYNTNTYDVIIATGNIDLFDTQSIQMIMELKKSQNKAIRRFEAMSDIYENQLVQITQNFPIFSNYSMGPDAKKLIWQTVDLEKLPLITDGITGLKHYNIRTFIGFNENILLKTEKLIEHLENLER
jgi:hypothetical protein